MWGTFVLRKEDFFMYTIGDQVLYPMHGAGVITSVEEREILGEIKQYFLMKMPVGNMEVLIPVESLERIGVRDIITSEQAVDVLRDFKECTIEFNKNWNKRYRENMEKIRSGNIYEVAHVVKSLMIRDRDKGLSAGERKMLISAKRILVSELILATKTEEATIEKEIDKIIEFC